MNYKIVTYSTLLSSFVLIGSCGMNKGTSEIVEEVANSVYETINEDYIDNTVAPQEDFFQYSNGTWLKNNPVPDSESRWGSFNELENKLNE